ncbi:MAG: hypothetical protein IKA17_08415 [Clostridia bacterium]|nr:hypothetical protein [Clostridia bacterium]
MIKKYIVPLLTVLLIFLLPLCTFAAEKLYTTSPTGIIPLRMQPDEKSYEIIKIPACSKIKVIEKRNTWGKVIFENKCGWINLCFTAPKYNDAAQTTGIDSVKNVSVEAKDGKTKLYNIPSVEEKLGSTVKVNIPNGTVLSLKRETENGWGLVLMNKNYAWVRMEDTKEFDSYGEDNLEEYGIFYVYVNSAGGNGIELKSRNSNDSSTLSTIPDCVKLTVREESGNFGYVSYNGLNGWINLKNTSNSYSNALSKTGKPLNEERTVISDGENLLMSVPSQDEESGTYSVGKVENGETVFILSETESGWSLISKNGVRGWFPTEHLGEASSQQKDNIEMCEAYEVFVSTEKAAGIKLYAYPDLESTRICTMPECAKITVVAQSGEFLYVMNDYAAGWTESREFANTYQEALEGKGEKIYSYYKIDDETTLRSLPIYSEICGSEELMLLEVGTEFSVERICQTGDRKWGLAEINGKQGWVNLNCADKSVPLIFNILIAAGIIAVLAAVVLLVVKIIRRKRNEQKI